MKSEKSLKDVESNKFFNLICRIGFCGEAYPRFILSTEIESVQDVLKKTEKNLYDQSVDFFNKIFFE